MRTFVLNYWHIMDFELVSDYQPMGDQPEAIAQLTEGVLSGVPAQTLLGVTGSALLHLPYLLDQL